MIQLILLQHKKILLQSNHGGSSGKAKTYLCCTGIHISSSDAGLSC